MFDMEQSKARLDEELRARPKVAMVHLAMYGIDGEIPACVPLPWLSQGRTPLPVPGGLTTWKPEDVTCPVCMKALEGWEWGDDCAHFICWSCDVPEEDGHDAGCRHVGSASAAIAKAQREAAAGPEAQA